MSVPPPDDKVIANAREDYEGNFLEDLLEQYKLFKSTITELQNDRNNNNRFLISICTALFGLESYLLKSPNDAVTYSHLLTATAALAISILGAAISYYWIRWGNNYATTLRTRYRILKGIEIHLPCQPFSREFEIRTESGYYPISKITINLAKIFMAAFILMLVFNAFTLFYQG